MMMTKTDRQKEFREWFIIIHDADPRYTKKDLWTYEATFETNGRVNKNKCIYWSDKNLH
jgi:uncharacterized protein YegL